MDKASMVILEQIATRLGYLYRSIESTSEEVNPQKTECLVKTEEAQKYLEMLVR